MQKHKHGRSVPNGCLNSTMKSSEGERHRNWGGPAAYGSYGVKKRVDKIDETIDLQGMRVLESRLRQRLLYG